MKNVIGLFLALTLSCLSVWGQTDKPLRVFIRAGPKTHGPGQHDGPRFLKEWKDLLTQRGARVDGATNFPSATQLGEADVLVMYAADGADIVGEQRANLEQFLKRGGGIVVIHDAICGHDAQWFKTVVGGAWEFGKSGFFEGDIALYYLDHENPITRGASNFDFDDEIYYDLQLVPEAHILAGAYKPDARNRHDGRIFPSVYDVAPQMWTYEKDNYRAFVSIPGHMYKSFDLPHFRAVLLRGIAWAAKRPVDSLASPEELASMRYPEGGPTAPEKAVAKIVVPPEFTINLVASEPMIEKPISMDWDAKGRLWVAETPEYPFRSDRTRAPYDRISILEDTKHTGHMDKSTVFCEGLDLVTSMVLYKDGAIVSQAPYIYWVRDTKGTGKADTKIMLYKGFGTNDTHAVVSNMRWGLDGWIYATVGYSKGDIYSGDGKTHFGRITDGVIRFRPDGSAVEQVSSKGSNTWGVDIGPDGEIFFTQANGNHIDHVVMPEPALARGRVGNATSYKNIEDHNRSYPLMTWKQQAYVQIDWVGNFTAAAGCCIYDGGAWPEQYNYTHYVAEPTINIVHQDLLKPDGVSYIASKDPERLEKEFVASTDLWFRPIHQRVGPDGALYILDFYNQAAVHNDTRGPRHDPKSNAAIRPDRDHYFGRIWRVQHKDAKKLQMPDLASARPAVLVGALEHPNEWVRATALRLLVERNKTDVVPMLEKIVKNEKFQSLARIHAFWALNNLGRFADVKAQPALLAGINSADASVAKNALEISTLPEGAKAEAVTGLRTAVMNRAQDANMRVRLEALIAMGRIGIDEPAVRSLIKTYSASGNPWLESAFVGVAASNPLAFISAALDAENPADLGTLVTQLAVKAADQQDANMAARLVVLTASKPAAVDGLKQAILETLTKESGRQVVPGWSPELGAAFHAMLTSTNADLATAALPLAARWDKGGTLANEIKDLVTRLAKTLIDEGQPDERRARLAASLLAVRELNADIMPSVAGILGSQASMVLQRRVIEAMGALPEPSVGELLTGAYPKLPSPLQEAALNQLLKRGDWSLKFVEAIQAGKVNLKALSPVAVNRLRTHSDKTVADRANTVIDQLNGPEAKEKDKLIAQYTPIVVQPGNAVKGKEAFTKNCAVCHKFNGEGKDIAPDLTGMGAHGPAELIIHILDPNREVEPNYYAYSVETKDGEIYDGIISRENNASLTLRNSSSDMEIKIKDIKSRRNTGLSLMPNGFEALGGETLRDILTFICAGEANFRIIDMKKAFTASTSKGLWISEDDLNDTLAFKKFGLVKEGGVPFEIVNPQKTPTGRNLVVLKGGSAVGKKYPQKVEIPDIGIKATRLYFLGGVGGWAYPWGTGLEDLPVAKVTVNYAEDKHEEIVLKNGQEFADWNGTSDVPGSKSAAELVRRGQVRWFAKTLKNPGVIQSMSLESYDNAVSPTFVAITADLGDKAAPETAETAPAPAGFKWGEGIHVLIVGGGSSHDFNRWFKTADSATLASEGKVSVNYTDKIGQVLPALKDVDVLYLSNNQPMTDKELRKAILDFADAGHGLVLVHPALWYNWTDWPEYNKTLVGGGARSHYNYGEFEVNVKEANHPVMAGVPATFRLKDELYRLTPDLNGTPVEVLAESKNLTDGKTFPTVWIVKHPKAKIVCITLGHDAASHDIEAYKSILRNAVKWAAGK